jgi:hypothetical protein
VYPTREEVNTLQTVFDPKFLINEPSSVLEHYCRYAHMSACLLLLLVVLVGGEGGGGVFASALVVLSTSARVCSTMLFNPTDYVGRSTMRSPMKSYYSSSL